MLTKLIMLVALSIFLSLLWTVLVQASVRTTIAVGWLVAATLVLIWIASVIGWVSRKIGFIALFSSVVLSALCILASQNILQEIFPHCGDGVCARGECSTQCSDCTKEQCYDGVCEPFEDCKSPDCPCGDTTICAPKRNSSDKQGCAPVLCSDKICDYPIESSQNCCSDCGCQQEYSCESNICYFNPPHITFVPFFIAKNISVTTLAVNPTLTDATGKPHHLMWIQLKNEVSSVDDVRVTFALGNITQTTVLIGTLLDGVSTNVTWRPEYRETMLNNTKTIRTNITLTIKYRDRQRIEHTSKWSYPFTLLNTGTMDSLGSVVFYVRPLDVLVEKKTPEAIWEELGLQLDVTEPHEGLRFPKETLARGSGSQNDLALVLASAFVRAKLRTSLVETDDGLYVRVFYNDQFVMLDPNRIDEKLDNAIVQRPGFAVHDVVQEWRVRNATISVS